MSSLTLSDLVALQPGDLVRIKGGAVHPDGDWYEVDQVWPVERASYGRASRHFHARSISNPLIGASAGLHIAWRHPAGGVVPGHTRDCVRRDSLMIAAE